MLPSAADAIGDVATFVIGHIKGMARTCSLLAILLVLKFVDENPKVCCKVLHSSVQCISIIFESHASMSSVALRTAQLSHRGSLRKALCALGWVGLLIKLQEQGSLTATGEGHDAATLINQYNNMTSAQAQIQGSKRVSILNLLTAPRKAVKRMLDCISRVSADGSPWSEDVWSKKTLLSGHKFRHANPLWTRLLSVTDESFYLMVEWQAKTCERKSPHARRRIDKSSMEEASHISALLVGLKEEVARQYNVSDEVWEKTMMDPLLKHGDQNLILAMQDLIHTKPMKLELTEVYGIGDIVSQSVHATDSKCVGVPRTQILAGDIERSEFDLFVKKIGADIQAVQLYSQKNRYCSTTSLPPCVC